MRTGLLTVNERIHRVKNKEREKATVNAVALD